METKKGLLVNKILKSKIDGKLFKITDLVKFETAPPRHTKQSYRIETLDNKLVGYVEKGWFEKGYMQNLEIIEDEE